MKAPIFEELVGPLLAGALVKRGFTALMPVQQAVLDPELAGRDLRISSQTGSGKTVAIGLAIRELAGGAAPSEKGVARPRALVVVPTRELAKQVDEELRWLYAPLGARVASATGGADIREERRAFATGPAVVVGTPGRLLDHLNRGSIDPRDLGAVVLDEADRMLDLGFREDLEAILAHAPPEHRTHLVSATFPRDVLQLANRVQKDPAHIEGTPLGTANADIDHLVHLVANHERMAAIVNLLLSTPGAQTLVFARTRADVADIARQLAEAGFDVRALSGEMEQAERNRALAAFKRGTLDAMVATDVAARGIDVQDIARVIHAEAPTDPDSYTHRSGRTGRAGKKGTSSVLVSPAGLARVSQLLRRSGAKFRMAPIPTAAELRRAAGERVLARLTGDGEGDGGSDAIDPRLTELAEKLAASGNVTRTIARLLARAQVAAGPEPRDVRPIQAPSFERPERAERPQRMERHHAPARDERSERAERPSRSKLPAERPSRAKLPAERPSRAKLPAERPSRAKLPAHEPRPREPRERGPETEWVPFRFTWGSEHGADPRRLLAMACRRGGIRAADIGAIRVGRTHSIVNVAGEVAETFARAAGEHDPRDPRVKVRREAEGAAHEEPPRPPPVNRPRVHEQDARPRGPRGAGHHGGDARPKRRP
jgi:ATP-dependent RNA helicase DeaD